MKNSNVMNLSFKNGLRAFSLALTMVLAFSCAQQKRDRSSGTTVDSIRAADLSPTCANGVSKAGMIYDTSSMFQQNLQNFISGWMNPTSLGGVDGNPQSTTTGVDFKGHWAFDTSGNLIQAQSNFKISIWDTYAVQTQSTGGSYVPITVTFDAEKFSSTKCQGTLTGTLNQSTKAYTVVATDCVGTIKFTGTYTSQYVDGSVTYQNKTSTTGTVQSGALGSLRIATCGIL